MGIAICLFAICSLGALIAFQNDAPGAAVVLLVGSISTCVCLCTLIGYEKTVTESCQDFGKLKINRTFYRCELIQGQ